MMRDSYLDIAVTPAVAAAQTEFNGRRYRAGADAPPINDRLGPAEAQFLAAADGFYLGTLSETGWPYIQYRGGPPGFLKVLDETRLGFADFRGNRQYLSVGNLTANDRVALFVMDYARKLRLKLFGRAMIVDPAADVMLREALGVSGYRARIEWLILIEVAAFNWNCPQHITRRFAEADVARALAERDARIAALAAENERLQARLAPDLAMPAATAVDG
jgi:predicted pyridoxine 5'-phosphate oxidase superfamily flavin-nucleotide-binding protein